MVSSVGYDAAILAGCGMIFVFAFPWANQLLGSMLMHIVVLGH
jgi:hypothetical protein